MFPIFRDAERVIADLPVRNRGTLGGALCQADPSEDLSSVCTTLDATLRDPRPVTGERMVSMDDFHRGPYETAVGQAEMLIEVRIPVRPQRRQRLREGRPAGRGLGRRGRRRRGLAGRTALIADARVGLAAVGPNTTGIPEISSALRGRPPDDEAWAVAGEIAARSCTPVTDGRGTVDYKRHLADELTRRTLRTAAQRAAERAAG